MKNLAPEIFRQRLLIEGYFTGDIDEARVRAFLNGIVQHLHLRAYSDAVIFTPASGMGREENAGFDAFIPLIDSGVSAYIWTRLRFFSVLLYTCKGFDEQAALDFAREFFGAEDELAYQAV